MAKHGTTGKMQAEGARNAKIIRISVAFVCVCLAFAAGFLIRGDQALLKLAGFESLIVSVDQNPGATVSGDTNDSISARVAEIQGILAADSVDTYDLGQVTADVLNSFADATADPYLRYFDEERYRTYMVENAGKYSGIGALFSEYNGLAYVVDVFEGSAAEATDVKQGDFIVAIDGNRSQEWSQTEVVNALSGHEEGDSVVITWRRPATFGAEGGEEFTTTLQVSAYSEPNLTSELSGQVGYIQLKQLTATSADLVSKAVLELEAQGAQSFVLDIRSNPGGYLSQAVDIASLFMKSGVVVEIDTKEAKTTKSTSLTSITEKPLVVLIDGNTSAAAEVLAAALKDGQRATLIGTTTLGKGSVQRVRELSFGGALRYTVGYYKTPLGHDINNVGVAPTVTVVAADDGTDNQLTYAIEAATNLIPAV